MRAPLRDEAFSARHARTGRGRLVLLVVSAALGLVLVAGSRPRRVGDGAEYLAMALQLASLEPPSLSDADLARMREYFVALDGGFDEANPTLGPASLVGADGRHDFPHFWLYPALAAPGVAVASALGLHPNYGFVAANLALLLVALAIVGDRAGWEAAVLLLLGPGLWWTDKAHTETFTVSLLAIGLALVADAPWWTMVVLAMASTQNLAIAIALPPVVAAAIATRPACVRDRRMWLGLAAAMALVVLHPLYYYLRLNVPEPQTLVRGTQLHVPRIAELGAFVWDPDLGILPNFPALGVVVAAAAWTVVRARSRTTLVWSLALPALVAVLFVTAFAQTPNYNSGGTPGPARYGLWLIPLAVPLLVAAGRLSPASRHALAPVAVASCLWAVWAYNPARPESYLTPTSLSAMLWERYPAAYDPLPDVFVERLTHREWFGPLPPTSTPTCSKVLVVGGAWPASCPRSAPIPLRCAGDGTMCYANRRTGGGYRFSSLR